MPSLLRAPWPLLGLALLLAACPASNDPEGTTDPSTGELTTEPTTTTSEGTTSEPGTSTSDPTASPTTTIASTGVDETTDDTMATTTDAGGPQVVFETTLGTIVIELDETAAPITTSNFLAYVDSGFFDGSDGLGATVFHRVIPGFVIQGGGLTEALVTKATMPPIVNESGNGLLNTRGTISMARTNDPNSATSQFFLNLVDNPFLDDPPGYAVFGSIVSGLEVMDAIAAVAVDPEDVPLEPVIILSATVQ